MAPLEAARCLAEGATPDNDDGFCVYCQRRIVGTQWAKAVPHAPDCPWLALPAIVRALEAAERLVQSDRLFVEGEGTWMLHCLSCEAVCRDAPGELIPHEEDCLVAALAGEEVVPRS
jgi:hypothetical protein